MKCEEGLFHEREAFGWRKREREREREGGRREKIEKDQRSYSFLLEAESGSIRTK